MRATKRETVRQKALYAAARSIVYKEFNEAAIKDGRSIIGKDDSDKTITLEYIREGVATTKDIVDALDEAGLLNNWYLLARKHNRTLTGDEKDYTEFAFELEGCIDRVIHRITRKKTETNEAGDIFDKIQSLEPDLNMKEYAERIGYSESYLCSSINRNRGKGTSKRFVDALHWYLDKLEGTAAQRASTFRVIVRLKSVKQAA